MRLIGIRQLLSALEWLENLEYTHGDLKVDNIGIDENNQLQVFDFSAQLGIAMRKAIGASS